MSQKSIFGVKAYTDGQLRMRKQKTILPSLTQKEEKKVLVQGRTFKIVVRE